MLDKTVLLVDYEPKGLSSMKTYLEGLGFAVDTATDGSMALTRFFEKRPDLIVLSPMLPKIHGFDVCRQITQSPEGKDIPVVIITAVYKGSKYRNEAIHSCGAKAYFERPFVEEELTDTIFKLLDIRRDTGVAAKSAAAPPAKEKSLEEMLPELKADRTMPFIKKSDVLATLQLEKKKAAAAIEEPAKPSAPPTPPPAPESFVTSEEIFGDVIESFESGKKAPAPPTKPPAAPPAAAPSEPTAKIAAPPKSAASTASRLDDLSSFAKGEMTPKKAPATAPKPGSGGSDVARKLEETLSGLSLDLPRAKPAKPAAAPSAAPPAPAPAPKVAAPPQLEVPAPAPKRPVEPPAPAVKVTPPPEPPAPVAVPEPPVQKVAPPPPAAPPRVEAPKPEPPAPRVEAPPREERPHVQAAPIVASAMPYKYGEYVLLEKIATGGMAELFKAKRSGPEGFEKILAIKRILPHLSDNEEFVTMFIDEAKVAAQLNHPNIVHIYDLGRIEDSYFIAMEFVQGRDLRTIIKELEKRNQSLPYDLAAHIAIKICEALDYAHRKLDYSQKPLNIVHRDVSPQNILISYEGEVKLVDFGVAKAASKAHHTTHGALKGKILYMSPEQAWGKSIDQRSDLFSLGSVLFEMTTGKKLFLGESEISTLEAVRNAKVIQPSALKRDYPPALEEVILKALKPKPDDRHSSASELLKSLQGYLDGVRSRPGPQAMSEFMFELYPEEMKAKGIRIEPRKPAPAERAPELTIRVDKPEVKVPPPKVIPVQEKPAPSPTPVASKAPAAATAAVQHEAQEINFKPILDTGMHTGYQQAKNRRNKIFAAIAAVAIVALGIAYFMSRKGAEPTVAQPVAGPTTPGQTTTGPGTTSSTTPPTTTTTPPATGTTTNGTQVPVTGTTTATPDAAAQQAAAEAQRKAAEDKKRLDDEARQRAADEQKQRDAEDARKKAEEDEAARVKAAEDEKKRVEDENRKKQEDDAKAAAQRAEDERKRLDALEKARQAEVREGDIIPVTQVDTKPVPVNRAPVVYPEIAKRQKIQGTVKLSVLVAETGAVTEVKVLSDTSTKMNILNEAAKNTVLRWKYQPATKSGKRVKVWLNVDIPFVLQ